LQRIEKSAFSYSGLKTFVIPNGIRFIDGSAFICCSLELISILPGVSDFCVFGSFLADRSHCLIVRYFGSINSVIIPSSVTHLYKSCFSNCKPLSSISFESESNLQRIEESAFAYSGLITTVIPASVTHLCKSCFSDCSSFSSISFETGSIGWAESPDYPPLCRDSEAPPWI
jgi:hypothetical protein